METYAMPGPYDWETMPRDGFVEGEGSVYVAEITEKSLSPAANILRATSSSNMECIRQDNILLWYRKTAGNLEKEKTTKQQQCIKCQLPLKHQVDDERMQRTLWPKRAKGVKKISNETRTAPPKDARLL